MKVSKGSLLLKRGGGDKGVWLNSPAQTRRIMECKDIQHDEVIDPSYWIPGNPSSIDRNVADPGVLISHSLSYGSSHVPEEESSVSLTSASATGFIGCLL